MQKVKENSEDEYDLLNYKEEDEIQAYTFYFIYPFDYKLYLELICQILSFYTSTRMFIAQEHWQHAFLYILGYATELMILQCRGMRKIIHFTLSYIFVILTAHKICKVLHVYFPLQNQLYIQIIIAQIFEGYYQNIQTLNMSQDYIDYDQYKKIIQQQAISPRRNIFEENRIISQQNQKLAADNIQLTNKVGHYRNLCVSMIDAIGRVFSQQLAQQLQQILERTDENDQASMLSNTIFEALVTHQSQPSISDWSQSRRSQTKTPEKIQGSWIKQAFSYRQNTSQQLSPSQSSKRKSVSPSPRSSIICNSIKNNDPSTNRSYNNVVSQIVATSINCEICQQTFAPNQFIQHASRCREESFTINMSLNTEQQTQNSQSVKQIDLQDTQDRKLKKQSQNYMKMMKGLILIQNQIQQQIQMLRFSKEKIDRDAEKRKLEKDLAKVMHVIEQKKKQAKFKENEKPKTSLKSMKMKKNSSIKLKT